MQTFSSKTAMRTATCAAASFAASAAILLSGCGTNGSGVTMASTTTSGAINVGGTVHGGQQPVAGSTIQLYAVGSTGSAATALIGVTVQTNSGGSFNITGMYTCPSATAQVYIVATGGNSGSGSNAGIAEAAALGPCGSLTGNSFIFIDELTTVAAAYALAPFENSSYTNVGAAGTSTGIVNAFASAAALVSTTTGAVAQPAIGITLPGAEINTLGDILAACVNTASSTSTQCNQLFTATGAANTFDAAFFIAKNPGATATTGLFSLVSGNAAPFQPTLTSRPNDFTLAVNYTGAELQTPYGLAVDASGNALVTNESGNTVTAAPPFSTAFSTGTTTAGGGLLGPRGIAVDTNGYVWIANTGRANVVELLNGYTTASLSAIPYRSLTLSGSAADAPVAVATDRSGNAYFVNPNSNNLYAVSAGGGVTKVMSTSFAFPLSIAYAPNGNLAVGNAAGQICTSTTALVAPTCVAQSPAQAIPAVAYNPGSGSGFGYATTTTNASYTTGAFGPLLGFGPFNGGGATLPPSLAFDGAGHAFLAGSTSISEFAAGTTGTAISPTAGFGAINAPIGIAVDPSGNVWTANSGDNSLTIFIGLGAATTTPLAGVI